MNNKKIRYILLFVISFFILNQRLLAADATIKAVKPNNQDKFYKYSYKVDYIHYTNEIPNYVRSMRAWTFYAKTRNNFVQAYCIQQKVDLGSGYSAGAKNGVKYAKYLGCSDNDVSCYNLRKKLISQIISSGFNIANQTSESAFKTEINKYNVEYILATQELIWEVVRGDRKSLNTNTVASSINNSSRVKYAPRKGCKASTCPFYNLIINNSNLKNILTYYKSIINKANNIFYKALSNFSTPGKEKTYGMDYDGKVFTKTFTNKNKNYNLFNYEASSGKFKFNVSKDGSKLIITSTEPLKKDVTITATNKNPARIEDDFSIYTNSTRQDVVTAHATISYSLKLSTPMYQLKIIKTDKRTGAKLKGAVFQVCKNNTCSSVIDTITTNDKGEAITKKIDKPGTYYIKEKSVPAGYVLDFSVKSIKVTSDNVAESTSFATKKITNAPKEFNLIKYTIDDSGEKTKLDGDCGTDKGPVFALKNSKGEDLYFTSKEGENGVYTYSGTKKLNNNTSELTTCNGEIKVYTLPECKYKISEIKAPDGLTLPSEPTKELNVCGADKRVSFTNGFTGLEFQKKNEDGKFLDGGTYTLQRKINNAYTDILLDEVTDGMYQYAQNLTDTSTGATYKLKTSEGTFMVSKLPPGDYRVVEIEAPEGYELIKDKDSKSLVTISDDSNGYYLVEMVDRKSNQAGSGDSAEFVLTITTGRKVLNYVFIISGLAILLGAVIIIRKKIKK